MGVARVHRHPDGLSGGVGAEQVRRKPKHRRCCTKGSLGCGPQVGAPENNGRLAYDCEQDVVALPHDLGGPDHFDDAERLAVADQRDDLERRSGGMRELDMERTSALEDLPSATRTVSPHCFLTTLGCHDP